MRRTDELIDRLAAGAVATRRPLPVGWAVTGWLAVSLLYATGVAVWLDPFRPGFQQQLLTHPRFALEMALGAGAAAAFAITAIAQSVPGRATGLWSALSWVLTAAWLGSIAAGLVLPVLEPSMLGKREACAFEAYLYSVPILAAGIWLQQRRFALAPIRSAAHAAMAAGLIPAVVMQIACMYAPRHALVAHVGPAVLVLLATLVTVSLLRARRPQRTTP